MRPLFPIVCLLAFAAGAPRAWAYEAGITPIVSSAPESGHLIKGAPGNLYSLYVTTGAAAGM